MSNGNPGSLDKPDISQKFLLTEYESLQTLEISRNDRLDRYVTIFLTLATAPFAVASFVLGSDKKIMFDALPIGLAWLFVLVGLLGFLVVLIIVQIRFNIILYVRAVNAIRGYFHTDAIHNALLLPTRANVPGYYERGKHIHILISGMGLINSLYVAFGLFHLLSSSSRLLLCTGLFLVLFMIHLSTYKRLGLARGKKDEGPGKLRF
jgi:uncharacterized membrane protein YqjE